MTQLGSNSAAVVVGASMAGLLAAAALAPRLGNVTVVEADELPDGPVPRKGVPQARHAHLLLAGGFDGIGRLLPGIGEAIVGAGAVTMDGSREVGFLVRGGWLEPHARAVPMVSLSRDLLDHVVRTRVASLGNVRFETGTRVEGLRVADGEARGVRTSRGDIAGDVVVDASGRGSRVLEWLAAAGSAPPPESVVDAGFGYATAVLDRLRPLPNGWKLVVVQPTQDCPRGGVIMQIEGGRGIVSLNGPAGSTPPTDPAGWCAYAASLITPVIADALPPESELGAIAGTRSTVNRLRHFWRTTLPAGLVVVGDAACTLNPIYAQGITVAAATVERLASLLDRCRSTRELSARFARAQLAAVAFPWIVATLEDLRYPATRGRRLPGMAFVQQCLDALFARGTRDPAAAEALERVLLLMDPPTRLLSPRLVTATLAAALRGEGPAPFEPVPRPRHG